MNSNIIPYSKPRFLSEKSIHSDEKIYIELKPAKANYFFASSFFLFLSIFSPTLFLISIPIFLLNLVSYINKTYAITSKRVILTGGILNKYFSECPLNKIQNVDLKTFIFSGGIGNLSFDTAGTFRKLKWDLISSPRDIYTQVSSILHSA